MACSFICFFSGTLPVDNFCTISWENNRYGTSEFSVILYSSFKTKAKRARICAIVCFAQSRRPPLVLFIRLITKCSCSTCNVTHAIASLAVAMQQKILCSTTSKNPNRADMESSVHYFTAITCKNIILVETKNKQTNRQEDIATLTDWKYRTVCHWCTNTFRRRPLNAVVRPLIIISYSRCFIKVIDFLYGMFFVFIWHLPLHYATAFSITLLKNTLFTRQISAIRFNQQNEYIQKVSFNISIS